MNSNAHGELHSMFAFQAAIERLKGLENAEACANGPLCIIFMRLGITIVDQQAIAEILRDVPVKMLDDLGTGRLVGIPPAALRRPGVRTGSLSTSCQRRRSTPAPCHFHPQPAVSPR